MLIPFGFAFVIVVVVVVVSRAALRTGGDVVVYTGTHVGANVVFCALPAMDVLDEDSPLRLLLVHSELGKVSWMCNTVCLK